MKARKNEEKAAKIRSKRTSKQSTKTGDYAVPQVALMSGAVRTTTTESERESAEDHPHNYIVMGGNQAGQEIPVSQDYNVPVQGQREPSSAPPESPRGVKGWLKSTFRSGNKGQKEENKPSLTEPVYTGASDRTETAVEDERVREEIPVASLDNATKGQKEENKPSLTEPVYTGATDRTETAVEDERAREEIPVASLDNATNGQKEENKPSLTEPVYTGTTDRTETAVEDERAREEKPVATLDNAINGDEDRPTSTASVLSSGSIEENRGTAKLENGDECGESRDRSNESDVAQPTFTAQRPISPARDSKFREAV